MNYGDKSLEFSLLGGPLHRLAGRLRLVRGTTNTLAVGVAIGFFLWIFVIALALAQGRVEQLFSLALISGHARLLLVIPLFFLAESLFDRRCTEFVNLLVRAQIVPVSASPALASIIGGVRRWTDSWIPEAICFVAAILLSISAQKLPLFGVTSTYGGGVPTEDIALAGQWYGLVALPVFRFLVLRWLWRLMQWGYFLWRLSRLPLRLIPTHPDGNAGLGHLEVVHAHFTPLILALSVLQSASFAEELVTGRMAFEAIYPALIVILVVDVLLFIAPMFIFTPKLWAARVQGLCDYMDLASSYVDAFDKKWLASSGAAKEADSQEPLLGTADLQSLADLGNSVKVVREMSWVPLSRRLLTDVGIAALLPMLPLLLFKYPAYEMAEKLLTGLLGL